MHVILTPVGSAGDVNPFVIVGRELRRRGHRVTLVAPAVFAGSASNAGLDFKPLGTAEEFERVTNNPDLWHPRRGLQVVFSQIAANLRRAYAALETVYEPDKTLLLAGSLALSTRTFGELHNVPVATMHLAPSIFRSDFKQPAMPSGADISGWPRWAKRLLWWGVDRWAIDPLIAPALNGWRAELGLPPVSRIFKSWINAPQRVLGLFPDWFGEPQPDWPGQLRLTGFVLSDDSCAPYSREAGLETADRGRSGSDDSLGLEQFLARGEAPVVFTPGSANRQATPFFRAGIEATSRLGRRALLVTGFREHLPPVLPAHVHHVSYAAFATLFPRAAAIVHHGGIGTCAQGLAAGVPQLVMPMGFDQPDNASRIAHLGVGETIEPGQFTAERVAAALSRLLSSADVADACQRCRDRVDGSRATRQAADLIEEQFTTFAPG
ncbi:MAG TPA: glycosyltransferase [Vicinamibacterales bacterium]|nr:glycosyltransferase [Vicinamibacterales bacterium]